MQTLQGVTGPAISGGYSPGQVGGPVVGGYRPAQIGGPGTYLPYQTTDWTSMFSAMMPMIMMVMMFAILMPMFKGITA